MMQVLCILVMHFFPLLANAGVNNFNDNNFVTELTKKTPPLIAQIEEQHTFHGLASYYNSVKYYVVGSDGLNRINAEDLVTLKKNQWLAIVGRFNVGLIYAGETPLHLSPSKLLSSEHSVNNNVRAFVRVVKKSELSSIAPELDRIRYAHLWKPLSWLAKVIETSLAAIHFYTPGNWGVTIVVFSILLKLFLMPVSIMTVNFQRKVSQVEAKLAPQIKEIKTKFDGEEAHNLIIAAHNNLGVSVFYSLKPMLGLFIQIPIMICVFNVLGEMPQLDGQSFLWIENLAYPDAIGYLAQAIPGLGNTVSLLPLIMTAIALLSATIFQNRHASDVENRRQKRTLYLMAAAFFVLFYPFPASMVMFWALANVIHLVQQQIIKI